jgi:sugar transferase (PEP-CTERM/EpsH1 system associated)
LKFLIVCQRVPFPPNKGEKLRTFHQIKYLLDLGHKVSICCPLDNSADLVSIDKLKSRYEISVISCPLPFKLLRLALGFLTGKPLSVANFYISILQQKFDRYLADNHFDAIFCTSSSMSEYVFNSGYLKSLKSTSTPAHLLFMDFMDLDSDKWSQYASTAKWPMNWVYRRESRLLGLYETRVEREFDASFFISQAEVDLFRVRFGSAEKIHVLGNGIDGDYFMPPAVDPNNGAPVFIFTGVMDYKPNIDAVTWVVDNAWQQIVDLYPGARFIIAGMTPTANILALAKSPGIEVTGFVDDILPYFHQAGYFLAPLRIARGVQNKVLQAFACGLPVIATNMGAEGIDYTDGEDILLANTPDEFIEQIKVLHSDAELRQRIKTNALALIRNRYSWDGQLKPLDTIINDLEKQLTEDGRWHES